jgi:peroxiredoxin
LAENIGISSESGKANEIFFKKHELQSQILVDKSLNTNVQP